MLTTSPTFSGQSGSGRSLVLSLALNEVLLACSSSGNPSGSTWSAVCLILFPTRSAKAFWRPNRQLQSGHRDRDRGLHHVPVPRSPPAAVAACRSPGVVSPPVLGLSPRAALSSFACRYSCLLNFSLLVHDLKQQNNEPSTHSLALYTQPVETSCVFVSTQQAFEPLRNQDSTAYNKQIYVSKIHFLVFSATVVP